MVWKDQNNVKNYKFLAKYLTALWYCKLIRSQIFAFWYQDGARNIKKMYDALLKLIIGEVCSW